MLILMAVFQSIAHAVETVCRSICKVQVRYSSAKGGVAMSSTSGGNDLAIASNGAPDSK